jgi:di- and tripeptidase
VVFIIEGEEESGSQGFHQTVREHKEEIGPVDWILLANSYWLDDYNPCLTYGLRGVVHANLVVTSDHPDLHSGIAGSALLDEPIKDLSLLVSTLVGRKGKINLPGFHDTVKPPTEAEEKRFQAIADVLLPHHPEIPSSQALIKSLTYRWREPSLTIHSMEVPGSKSGTTTIARKAKASLSIRIVPDQEADDVAANLTAFAQEQFDLLESQNDLTVEITGKSDAWLGDPDNQIFATLSDAITAAWTPNEQTSKHQYPAVPQLTNGRATPTSKPSAAHTLLRQDSSDSLASHVDRVITSTTTSSAGKAAARRRSAQQSGNVPTSSTLTQAAAASASSSESLSLPVRSQSEPQSDTSDLPISPSQDTRSGVKPIFIREGGSIPTIRFLEKEFSAPAANLPCGQASDNAHLDNERMRVENLYKSREIFRYVFAHLVDKV